MKNFDSEKITKKQNVAFKFSIYYRYFLFKTYLHNETKGTFTLQFSDNFLS